MKKLSYTQIIFLLTILCAPLYLIKINIFNLPSNVFEVLMIASIVSSFFEKRKIIIENLADLPKLSLTSVFLIFIGITLSIIFNNNALIGLGILKGWFILPILFSFFLLTQINTLQYLNKIFASIYFSSVLVASIAIAYKLFNIITYDNRLTAFYLSPNYLAMYLANGVFFGVYFLSNAYNENKFSKKTLYYLLTLSLILLPIYYTYSYGSWIAIFLSLLITLLITKPKKKYLFFLILIILLGFLFILQFNSEKFYSLAHFSDRSSLASRQTIWQVSTDLIKQKPFLGIGPGNFQESYLSMQKNYPPYLEWAVPEPHNVFLAFWLQTGLVGFAGFLMILFFIFKTLFLFIKNKKDAAFATPLLGFFIYTILHGLIDTTYWKNDLAFLFWICTFLSLSLHRVTKKFVS